MRAVVTARARRDLFVLLATSHTQFGAAAQRRYRLLLDDALLCHSRHSRQRTPAAQRVGRPRHVLVFRVRSGDVEILRILHDAMDLPSHMAGL